MHGNMEFFEQSLFETKKKIEKNNWHVSNLLENIIFNIKILIINNKYLFWYCIDLYQHF